MFVDQSDMLSFAINNITVLVLEGVLNAQIKHKKKLLKRFALHIDFLQNLPTFRRQSINKV